MSDYLIISGLKIDDYNCNHSDTVIGNVPAVSAVCGFVHNLLRGYADIFVENGVAIIYHNAVSRMGIEKHSNSLYGQRSKAAANGASIVEKYLGHGTLSLVIHLDIRDDDAFDDIASSLAMDLKEALKGARIASGALDFRTEPKVSVCTSSLAYQTALDEIPFGYILADKTDDIKDNTSWDSVINLIDAKKIDGKWEYSKYIPIAIGYAAIETPERRETHAGQRVHCYAETVTGLAEFVPFSTSSIDLGFRMCNTPNIQGNQDDAPAFFWAATYSENALTYLYRGHR